MNAHDNSPLFTQHEEATLMQTQMQSTEEQPCELSTSTSNPPAPLPSPYVIKDQVYPDIAKHCREELLRLLQKSMQPDGNVHLQSAAMGTRHPSSSAAAAASFSVSLSANNPVEWLNTQYRGDKMLWVTPELCRQEGLTHVTTLVQRLIRTCSRLRKTHMPPENQSVLSDFSVQFAVYVSH
jgi:hypothetical protein